MKLVAKTEKLDAPVRVLVAKNVPRARQLLLVGIDCDRKLRVMVRRDFSIVTAYTFRDECEYLPSVSQLAIDRDLWICCDTGDLRAVSIHREESEPEIVVGETAADVAPPPPCDFENIFWDVHPVKHGVLPPRAR